MPDVDDKVMKFVEDTLKRSPKIQLEELFSRARKAHASIRDLSRRQFNARYPLQVKRRRAQASRQKGRGPGRSPSASSVTSGRKGPRKPRDPRDGVRQVFLQFATDIAGAEERKDLVKVLANVDAYVDQVLKKMG